MYTHKHLLVGLAALFAASSVGGALFVGELLPEQVQEQLMNTIDDASASYRLRNSASAVASFQTSVINDTKTKLEALSKKKHDLRMHIVEIQKACADMRGKAEKSQFSKLQAQNDVVELREDMNGLVQFSLAKAEHDSTGPLLLRTLTSNRSGNLRERTMGAMEVPALLHAQEQLLARAQEKAKTTDTAYYALHTAAEDQCKVVDVLLSDLEDERAEYLDLLAKQERAQHGLLLSTNELTAVKQEVAVIHRQVLKMQSQLARLDARQESKSERSLIELGILPSKSGSEVTPRVLALHFAWPAQSWVSAGFHDPGYFKFFGIPHQGIDIMVGQGTSVVSAADGIVFVVKEGGATGYTYVLIGHEQGYATLYGHLSQVYVQPGQSVRRGEIIGLSGGTPGTPGAGLITTGPHLHFEVMSQGVNIDPKSVLP